SRCTTQRLRPASTGARTTRTISWSASVSRVHCNACVRRYNRGSGRGSRDLLDPVRLPFPAVVEDGVQTLSVIGRSRNGAERCADLRSESALDQAERAVRAQVQRLGGEAEVGVHLGGVEATEQRAPREVGDLSRVDLAIE